MPEQALVPLGLTDFVITDMTLEMSVGQRIQVWAEPLPRVISHEFELLISGYSPTGKYPHLMNRDEVMPGVFCTEMRIEHRWLNDHDFVAYTFEWNTITGPQVEVEYDERNQAQRFRFVYSDDRSWSARWWSVNRDAKPEDETNYAGPRQLNEPPVEWNDEGYDYPVDLGPDGELK